MTTTNAAEFLATLPAALTLRGPARASHEDVIKRIRQDVAAAIKAGALPAGTKVSVRGWVTVEIVAWTGPVFSDAYYAHLLDPSTLFEARLTADRYSPALAAALRLLETIANLHNFDESRIQEDYFHVGYYDHVGCGTVEAAAMRGAELERDPALGELQQRARAAAAALGPKCTRSVLGRGGFDTAGEWSLNQLIRVATRAAGRPVAYDKSRRAWLPVSESA